MNKSLTNGRGSGFRTAVGRTLELAAALLLPPIRTFILWRQFKALKALDDRLLADIGLTRDDILAMQRHGWRQDPIRVLDRLRGEE